MNHGASGLFWIASSDLEIATARAVLRSLKPAGVLDELGFLTLLGAFSDRLYPGISTIMTRARYFFFVPAIYRHIESLPLGKRRHPATQARTLQIRLCQALLKGDPEQLGIIGKRTQGRVVRLPSSVYWAGLVTLGIANTAKSESAYQASLTSPVAGGQFHDDDGVVHDSDDGSFWDAGIPLSAMPRLDGGDLPALRMAMTSQEAKYLRDRFLARDAAHGETSMLGHLLQADVAGNEFDAPWHVHGLPTELEAIAKHAERVSLLARGAQLLYESMLFDARRIEDPGSDGAFSAWWQTASGSLKGWRFDEFECLGIVRRTKFRGDVQFLSQWLHLLRSGRSPAMIFRAQEVRELFRQRERRVRGVKARLDSSFHLEQWTPPEGYDLRRVHAFNYRHDIGRQILLDIKVGISEGRRR